jgi:arylsulfatase A-like enzyme
MRDAEPCAGGLGGASGIEGGADDNRAEGRASTSFALLTRMRPTARLRRVFSKILDPARRANIHPHRMPQSIDTRRLVALAVLIASAMCATCGGSQHAERPSFERITLAANGPGTFDRAPRSALKLATQDDMHKFLIKDCRAEWVEASPDGVSEAGLRLTGVPGGNVHARLPGPFDLRKFNAVVIRATTTGAVGTVRLRHPSGPPVTFERLVAFMDRETPQVTIELRPVAPAELATPCEALDLTFVDVVADVTIHSIELMSIPVTSSLPEPGEAPKLVRIGNQSRCGVGLFAGRPLTAELDVAAGDALALSLGQTNTVFESCGPSTLSVTLSDGQTSTPLTQVEFGAGAVDAWRSMRLPLDTFAGRHVRATFELASARPENGVVVAELARVSNNPQAPTVVLITSDTHRADHLNVANLGVSITTPTIDALAARGVWFEDCFSTTNCTLPSHVAMLTGLNPRDTRIVDNFVKLSPDALTLAERFHDAGFRTWAATSAMQLSPEHGGLGQGFDRFACTLDGIRTAPDTLKFLREWQGEADGQPLFLWVHLFDAHMPYIPPAEFAKPYYRGNEPLDPSSTAGRPNEKSVGDSDLMLAEYSGEVSFLDDQLTCILDDARLGHGIVAFTGDHGESLGEHGIFWDHKGLYTATVHVPLIISWPDAPRGKRISAPVSNNSIARTLLELANVPGSGFEAPSLVPLMRGAAGPSAPRYEVAAQGLQAAITSDGWHLILELADNERPDGTHFTHATKHSLELYNVANDPKCERELSASEHARARALRLQLIEWLSAARGPGLSSTTKMNSVAAKQLAALGYAATPTTSMAGEWFDASCACAECAKWR